MSSSRQSKDRHDTRNGMAGPYFYVERHDDDKPHRLINLGHGAIICIEIYGDIDRPNYIQLFLPMNVGESAIRISPERWASLRERLEIVGTPAKEEAQP